MLGPTHTGIGTSTSASLSCSVGRSDMACLRLGCCHSASGVPGARHDGNGDRRMERRPPCHDGRVTLLGRVIPFLGLALAIVGVLLPVLPPVPFLLLAAAAASRGWPWLDERLLAHPLYGPT